LVLHRDNASAGDSTAWPEEARQCNPSLPIEMEDVATRMRGDAIGNTLYSECWVIKVLMKLAKVRNTFVRVMSLKHSSKVKTKVLEVYVEV
jgi:hypothetical protein